MADPADGLPYPLVVQDRDMRTLLEVRPPDAAAGEGGSAEAAHPVLPPPRGGEGIIVPTVRLLPPLEQPDELLVREAGPPVVQRSAAEVPDVPGTSAVALAALAAWRSAEAAVAADPPYIRYVQVVLGALFAFFVGGLAWDVCAGQPSRAGSTAEQNLPVMWNRCAWPFSRPSPLTHPHPTHTHSPAAHP